MGITQQQTMDFCGRIHFAVEYLNLVVAVHAELAVGIIDEGQVTKVTGQKVFEFRIDWI